MLAEIIAVCSHLPRGGKSVKGSTHMGLLGVSLTMAASPDLMNLGLSSTDLPVRRSTFSLISANWKKKMRLDQERRRLYKNNEDFGIFVQVYYR